MAKATDTFNKVATPEFIAWVEENKKQRGLTFEQIAKLSNFSRVHIHKVLKGEKSVSANLCVGLANAFHVKPSEALLAAGMPVYCAN